MSNWMDRPLPEIAAALRDGTLNARELTEEAIARHEKWDVQLGAYKTWNADYARQQAEAADAAFIAGQDRGPAQGIPFSVSNWGHSGQLSRVNA